MFSRLIDFFYGKSGTTIEMNPIGYTIRGVDATNPSFLAFRALLSMEKGDWNSALTDLNRPDNNSAAFSRRAKVYVKQNNFNLAINDYTQALTLENTKSVYLHTMRGKAYMKMGELALAAADFEAARLEAKENQPPGEIPFSCSAPAHYMGNIHLQQREWDEAINSFDEALKGNKLRRESYAGKALALFHKGKYENAKGAALEALKLAPSNDMALALLGGILAKQGFFKESLETLEKANQDNLFVLTQMGVWFFLRKQTDSALEKFNAVLARDPDDIYCLSQRGHLYLQQRRETEALADFQRVIALDPHNLFAWTRLIELLNRANRLEEAVPPNELLRARVSGLRGDIESAAAIIDAVLEHDSGNKLAWQQKGDLCLHMGQDDKAMECYDRVLCLDPYSVGAHLGKSHITMKRCQFNTSYLQMREGEKLDPYYLTFLTFREGEESRNIFSLVN